MEDKKKQIETIDLRLIVEKLWSRKMLFMKVLPVVFVLACIYILGFPRTYESTAKLAPEMDNSLSGGTLGALASSFGFDLGDMQTSDAITPLLYPELMEDNGFVVGLFDMVVESEDGEIKTTYFDYLKTKQKPVIWNIPLSWVKKQFKSSEKTKGKGDGELNPYRLSAGENDVAESIRNNVKLTIDKKTGVITIVVKAQDALICKTVCDSVMSRLQNFITNYRTNKARNDYEYYKQLVDESKNEYEQARRQYARSADANSKIALRSMELKLEDMENDMQMKFNAYTTLNTQLQAANAKVQENTPAFTILQGAAVPVKPSGPKRMIFVAGMTLLAFFVTAFVIVRKDLHFSF